MKKKQKQASSKRGAQLSAKGKNAQGAGASPRPNTLSAKGRLLSLYGKIPVLPFLDRPTSALLIALMAFYFIFTAWVFFSSPPAQISGAIVEGPLAKNSGLAIAPGERYVYQLSGFGSDQSVSYQASSSPGCAGLLITESSGGPGLCLSRSGNIVGDAAQLNSTYGNQSILLFAPWMLAASENFSWRVETTISGGQMELQIPTRLFWQSTSWVLGRRAFQIVVSSEAGSERPSSEYIDAEKRVLLYARMGNATAKLVQAPFTLDLSQIPQN